MPQHQHAGALKQLRADLGEPVVVMGRVGGVEHMAGGRGVAPLVHGADKRELADAALAFKGQPLAALVARLREPAGPPPGRA